MISCLGRCMLLLQSHLHTAIWICPLLPVIITMILCGIFSIVIDLLFYYSPQFRAPLSSLFFENTNKNWKRLWTWRKASRVAVAAIWCGLSLRCKMSVGQRLSQMGWVSGCGFLPEAAYVLGEVKRVNGTATSNRNYVTLNETFQSHLVLWNHGKILVLSFWR